jgi:hypothetical protein
VLVSRDRDVSVGSVRWMNVRGMMLEVVGKIWDEGPVKV